jgi:hypothetical protein
MEQSAGKIRIYKLKLLKINMKTWKIVMIFAFLIIGLVIGYNLGKGIIVPPCENMKLFIAEQGLGCEEIQQQIIQNSAIKGAIYGSIFGLIIGLLIILVTYLILKKN